MKKIILIFLQIIFCYTIGYAQQKFSIDQAVKYGEEHAYKMIEANLDKKQAKKKIWENIAQGMPQINMASNWNDNLELATALLPAQMLGGKKGDYIGVKFGQQYTLDANISASQLIFSGTFIIGIKASKLFYKLTETKSEKVRQIIKKNIIQAYFFALIAEENKKNLSLTLENTKNIYEQTKAYVQEGFREDTDMDRARLSVLNIENKIKEADASIKSAKMTLKYLIGIDINTKIELSDNLEYLINNILTENTEYQAFDTNNNIDFILLQNQKALQKQLYLKEISMYLPTLSAFAYYGKNVASNQWKLFNKNNRWYSSAAIGLKLNIPIFSSGRRLVKVQQEKIAIQKLDNKLKEKEQDLTKNKIITQNNFNKAKDQYYLCSDSKNLAKKVYKKTQVKYQEGVSTSFELSQQEQQYLQSYFAYINSIIGLLSADLEHKEVLGKL